MQAKLTNQRGGSLAYKHMKRKPANRLDGTKCPNDALRCGTHLLRFRATSPRPCPPKHSHWFWSVGVSWELWDSCCNRTPDINKFHWRHKAYRHNHSPTNHPKSFSHSEVGLESKSIIWTSRIIHYNPISFVLFWETSAVLSRKSSPRSYHSLGLCRLQIGWDLGLAASRSTLRSLSAIWSELLLRYACVVLLVKGKNGPWLYGHVPSPCPQQLKKNISHWWVAAKSQNVP